MDVIRWVLLGTGLQRGEVAHIAWTWQSQTSNTDDSVLTTTVPTHVSIQTVIS